MNKRLPLSLLAVLAIASATASARQSPASTGSLPVPANKIVGLWDTQPSVAPCGSPPPTGPTGRTTLLFITGGTWVENPRFPPSGIPGTDGVSQRSAGLGVWSYDPRTAQDTAHMQFDWYLDGAYDGYQTVDRTILLSSDGKLASGPVRSTRYAASGSVLMELCGSAAGTRL